MWWNCGLVSFSSQFTAFTSIFWEEPTEVKWKQWRERQRTVTVLLCRWWMWSLLFGLLVGGERVVQFRNAPLKLVHHERPVLVKEHRHRLGELGFSPDLRLPVRERDSEGVLVVEPERHNTINSHIMRTANDTETPSECIVGKGSDLFREEDSCQTWSGSIPAGSFCSATRKMFFSL